MPDEELSSAHGLLIAWGFIKFKLIGREGIVYQLSSLGIQAAEGRLRSGDCTEMTADAA